jgi:hypothetical protein
VKTKKITRLFKQELKVINLGLAAFGDSLQEQDIKVMQMSWRPPAGGNKKLIALLKKINR